MQKTKHVLIGCGLILALGGQIAPVHAQQPARGLVTTVSMSRAAQIFDMSPTGTMYPPFWYTPTFDASSWDHVSLVSPRVLNCARRQAGPSWTDQHGYWGSSQTAHYLFRQVIALPRAANYYGSVLSFAGVLGGYKAFVNGRAVTFDFHQGYVSHGRSSIAASLRPGANVIVVDAIGVPASSHPSCSAFTYSATLRAAGVKQ